MGESHLDPALVVQGRKNLPVDTVGDETFWTDTLKLHRVIRRSVSPAAALRLGLKVDVQALPAAVRTSGSPSRAGRRRTSWSS